ncbi:MAG: peptide chain release factor N(5)-glutamine methyltransferase [Rubricoccaceae bacterium]|nr:peptide chain release factor N(5)-glutamine methyltransferase [Rubricoccaceae bacterium]
MTRRALLEQTLARLQEAGIEEARRNAEWLLEEGLGASRVEILARPEAPVSTGEALQVEALVARRLRREPLQYVLGHADFFGLRLRVTPAVLIPRPETEEVAEDALRRLDGRETPWALDVGTGSGALALALKHRRPDAEVFACDVSEAALAVAADNAERLGLAVSFVQGDVLDPAFGHDAPPSFDLVVSNPPYVPETERATLAPEVRDHEPAEALFVPGDDPLVFYRTLAARAPDLLKPGGWLVVETHADHGEAVRDLFAGAGLREAALRRDLAGRPRIVSARLSP